MVEKPKEPKRQVPTIKDFEEWVKGRTGLTQEEFFNVWVDVYNLTPEQTKALRGQLKIEKPKPPPPPPPKPPPPPPPIKPKVPPELVIERIPYPKWWRDSLNAKIDLTAPGSATLATVTGKLRLFVATIVLTVTGETAISFQFGNAGSSGPIYLGGENQPMGIVIAMGNSPAPCGEGSLSISATDPNDETPSVGGFATCFAEESK
jgi:hypothetical protein